MTVVVTRLAGFEIAGSFLLAVAFSNIFAFIGLFGVRSHLICDVHEKFTNGEYVTARIVSTIFSLLPFVLLLATKGYDPQTTLACIAYMLFKSVEGFSDIFLGIMQRSNRFDWLAVSYTLKGALSLTAFTLLLYNGHSLFVSILGMTVALLPVLCCYDAPRLRPLRTFSLSCANLRSLYVICFPLMLHSLLMAVLIYLPREAIGRIHGATNVGYYGALAMIITVCSTLAGAAFSGLAPSMSRMIADRKGAALKKLLTSVAFSFLAGSVVLFILAKLLGPWVFARLFGSDILPYMYLLTPILINSLLLMCVVFFDGFLVAMEQRGLLLLCNILGTGICWLTVTPLTQQYGMYGANLSMIGGLALRFLLLSALSLWLFNKRLGPPTTQSINCGVDISSVP